MVPIFCKPRWTRLELNNYSTIRTAVESSVPIDWVLVEANLCCVLDQTLKHFARAILCRLENRTCAGSRVIVSLFRVRRKHAFRVYSQWEQ